MLKITNLHKWFGGVHALDGVDLEIRKKEILGVIGPNGSGKTTLFNTISGIYKPDMGEILFEGQRIDGLSPDKIFKRGLVRSFQIPRLYMGMTLLENLLVPPPGQKGEKLRYAAIHSKWYDQEVELGQRATERLDALTLLRVYDNNPTAISGGQMKLAEMGKVLMGNPKLVLLDEPTVGVAPKLALDIFRRIVALRDSSDLTFCIIEHRLDVLFQFIERVVVLHEGRIIFEGTHDALLADKTVQDVYLGG